MAEQITSIKDPRVVLARELQSEVGRKKHKKFLLYGMEQIKWALDMGVTVECIFSSTEVILAAPLIIVSEGIVKKISGTNYLVPQVAIAQMPITENLANKDFVVVLDRVKDYGNVGTIIRTAQGFSVDTFLFSGVGADPFQRKAIDSSRGSVFQSTIMHENNACDSIDRLKKLGYQLVVTSPHATHLQSQIPLIPGKPIALVIGNETEGVDDSFIKAADIAIQIPMSHAIESLNVGVAAGISLYELRFKQVLLMLKEKIFTNFGREVNLVGKYIRMAFDKEITRVTSLSGMQVILLMIMHCDQTMSREQIVRDAQLTHDEFDAFMQPLFDKKLVNKNGEYNLSAEGERFLAEIWLVIEKTQKKITALLSDDEFNQLVALLGKVKKSCEAIIENKIK